MTTDVSLRILFLADAVFQDAPGGSRVVARELAHGLARRGHDVTFLVPRQSPGPPDDEQTGGVRIVRYPGAGRVAPFVWEGRRACARLCAEAPFDLAHTHFAYAALGPLTALPRATPHVRSFYGPWDEEGWVEDSQRPAGRVGRLKARLKRRLRHQVEAANLRRSRRVIVLSRHSRDEVRASGYPDAHVRKVPGGADVGRFLPPADKAAVRRLLDLPQERCLLLSVRRLAPRMGLGNLIRAMPGVAALRPDVLLLIGGTGPEREPLQRLITELRMESFVRLVGFIPDDRLAAFYQASDLFVLPTLALEGFGLVTTESLACGVPVIGTPVGATPELLGGLDTRLIASGTGPAALAAALLGFLEGEWRRQLTPERLRRFVLDHYTWDKHVDAVEAVYREALAETARR